MELKFKFEIRYYLKVVKFGDFKDEHLKSILNAFAAFEI